MALPLFSRILLSCFFISIFVQASESIYKYRYSQKRISSSCAMFNYKCNVLFWFDDTHVLLYSCTPVLLYSCNPVLLYSCTPVLMYSCTPVLLYSCTPVLLCFSTPVLLYYLGGKRSIVRLYSSL